MSIENPEQLEFPLSAEEVVGTLRTIHRGDDGYIGFARKDGEGGMLANFSIQARELADMFPAIAHWLIKDAYFTVNSMYRTAPWLDKTGLPAAWRQTKHLRYLNACYVDLDVGRGGLTWRDASAALGNAMDKGLLPQCSLFARSGRGVYVFWLLHDDANNEQPPRYWPERLALYKKLNQVIGARLKNVRWDKKCFDPARVLRVPGTQHSNGELATYWIQSDADGRPFSYSLSDLCEFFGVREMEISLPSALRDEADEIGEVEEINEAARLWDAERDATFGRVTVDAGSAPARRRGQLELNRVRAVDLVSLEQARGGWKQGHRRATMEIYVEFLRGAGTNKAACLSALRAMAANCQPPYPTPKSNDCTLANIVRTVFDAPQKKYSDANLVEWLAIKPHEARALDLRSMLPEEIRAERKPPEGGERGAKQKARRAFLLDFIQQHGMKSVRVFKSALADNGLDASVSTINGDLAALNYSTVARKSAGRPKNELSLFGASEAEETAGPKN